MTVARWTGEDGWPRDWPLPLAEALRALPGGDKLTPEQVDGLARRLADAAIEGQTRELPRARIASKVATDKSLKAIHDACERLTLLLDDLHSPARQAMIDEGVNMDRLRAEVAQAGEAARHSWGYTPAPDKKLGRHPSVAAGMVTVVAAKIFECVSGRKAAITKHPVTYKVSGEFPAFLGRCFKALYIKASVEAQIAALREKKGAD